MADQLPSISGNSAISAIATSSTSLIGRGLSAIQHKETGLSQSELDARYRQARDIYNRITDYGWEKRFNSESMPKYGVQFDLFEDNQLPFFVMLQQLADVFTEFQQLANKGYGKAYFPLASMYLGGQGISKNIKKAHYYGRLAFDWCFVNQGLDDPEIWRDLGTMYGKGCGVERSYRQTVFWYRKAAEQGIENAQLLLGMMYDAGRGVEQDDELAVFWYRKAAEQGNARAQLFLGLMYKGGRGIQQDDEQAVFWYRKAAEQGNAVAQKKLIKLGINWKDA